eukprot:scaffold30773_cov54-Phaeocystis_antarctica.AAC.1
MSAVHQAAIADEVHQAERLRHEPGHDTPDRIVEARDRGGAADLDHGRHTWLGLGLGLGLGLELGLGLGLGLGVG